MATENKRLNTRLMLKYDSYANWTTNNPSLLKGEVAIAYIDVDDNTQTHSGQAVPQLLMKVGNGLEGDAGKYNSLSFVSGLAADVHSWAKAADKPTYTITEISGAKEYRTVQGTNEYTWILQARKASSSLESDWADVSTINLAKISERIATIEGKVTTAEGKITTLEGTVGDASKGLVKDVADLKALMGEDGEGSVSDKITDAINALNTPEGGVGHPVGADGLALNVVQENGIITSISGSIAANTYDAYGSASAVEGKLTAYQTTNNAAVKAAKDAADAAQADVDQEILDRQAAINALKMTAAVEGAQEGTSVKFIDKVYQENGIVSAELGELVFKSAYNASTNKAATMADVTGAVADLNGAMHFEGFTTTDPATGTITIEDKPDYVAAAGDVVIYNTIEYVYDGSKWNKLGEEGALGSALEALTNASIVAPSASETISLISQENGAVTATKQSIQIEQSQVTGLTTVGNTKGRLETIEESVATEKSRAEGIEAGLKERLDTVQGEDTAKTMREVAEEVASDSLEILTNASIVAPTAAQTISLISQENGVVTATAQDIQITESQVTGLTDALAAKATEADLTLAENKIKANEDAITLINNTTIDSKINTALEGLDSTSAGDGPVVTGVTQTNGAVSVTRGTIDIKDVAQTADTYVVFDCGSSSVNV